MNTTQRKLLDKLVSGRMESAKKEVLANREVQLLALRKSILKKEEKNFKALLEAGRKFQTLLRKNAEKLSNKSIGLDGTSYMMGSPREIKLYFTMTNGHPEIVKFTAETNTIKSDLDKKMTMIRMKIYGSDMTYEDMEAEIDKLMKDFK